MPAAFRAKPLRKDQPHVLQVSLAPAPVALEMIEEGRRRLLETSAKIRCQMKLPPRSAKQRRFHKIVTENFAAQRRASGQCGKPAILNEGLHANDSVMPPVISSV